MTMTPEEARSVARPPVEIGKSYEFYCEVQQEYEPAEKRLRQYTGQTVTVIRQLARPDELDEECSDAFIVRASDGHGFTAHVEELNDWDRDLGQYFNPDATYGPSRETWPLANERETP